MNLEQTIASLYPLPFQIMLHSNKSSIIKIDKRGQWTRFHLHRSFLEAPLSLIEAIVRFARHKDPKDQAILRQMARAHFLTHRQAPLPLIAQGKVYDLNLFYTRLKERYFDSSYDVAIGWSKRVPKGAFRSITFGSFDRYRHQIRMNPLLDHEEVPSFFLEFVVYHEMLHAVCAPVIDEGGKAHVHTKEFKEREKLHPFFASAKAWGKKSLTLLKRIADGRT